MLCFLIIVFKKKHIITFKEQILLQGIEITQYTYTWFAITMKQISLKNLKSSPQHDEYKHYI